jgi:cytochrome c-type biogenesis protein CcmE
VGWALGVHLLGGAGEPAGLARLLTGRAALAVTAPAPTPIRITGRRRRLWLAAAVVLLALGFLLLRGLNDATLYFRTADEAVAQREMLGERRFRIEGLVADGSVRPTGEEAVGFRIEENGVSVPVQHRGDPPELFRPGIPVVLEGRFDGEVFSSDRIMVKHTSEYRAEHPERVDRPRP